MTDGQTLKAFIEGQPISRTRIAKDLKMTRQNLYNLYESVKLTDDTKQKFEGYFGKKIFDKATSETKKQAEIAQQPEPDENSIALITARNYEKLINTNSELAKAVLEQRKLTTEVEKKILEISVSTEVLQVMLLNYHEFWIDHQTDWHFTDQSSHDLHLTGNSAYGKVSNKEMGEAPLNKEGFIIMLSLVVITIVFWLLSLL